MYQVGKVLYLLNDKTYVHCEHETLVIRVDDQEKQRIPISTIQQIIIFGNTTVSSFFISDCIKAGINVSYVSVYGKYYGGFRGETIGNVLLRQKQYRLYDDEPQRLQLVKNIVLGKGLNQRSLLRYELKSAIGENKSTIEESIKQIGDQLGNLRDAYCIDSVRGIEGKIAAIYFDAFDALIKSKDEEMKFIKRSRRPPENNCNALLSFLYTMLNLNCISALECFGLDSYLGFLHELRSGRESLALDLIEEYRAPFVDRLVVKCINERTITSSDFTHESNRILLKEESRKKVLKIWEEEQSKEIMHALYKKNVARRMLPYLQAQLLSQYIRGDIEEYPPWYMEV